MDLTLRRNSLLTDETILKVLNDFSEDEMTEKVILPLYKKRFKGKFQGIEFTGKNKVEDGGVDLLYYEIKADTKSKSYSGVQVKQGAINTGKGANGIAAISIQAQQAFNKPINDTADKKTYRIHSYVLLTSGEIQAKARAQIVDQFEHKPIDFVDGKALCEWIRESFLDEFNDILKAAGVESEEEEEEELSPLATVETYVQDKYETEIDDITATINTISTGQAKIYKALMLLGSATTFEIAKHLGRKSTFIEDDLDYLLGEDVITSDEGGYEIKASADEWRTVSKAIAKRIGQLGYDDGTVSVEEVMEELF